MDSRAEDIINLLKDWKIGKSDRENLEVSTEMSSTIDACTEYLTPSVSESSLATSVSCAGDAEKSARTLPNSLSPEDLNKGHLKKDHLEDLPSPPPEGSSPQKRFSPTGTSSKDHSPEDLGKGHLKKGPLDCLPSPLPGGSRPQIRFSPAGTPVSSTKNHSPEDLGKGHLKKDLEGLQSPPPEGSRPQSRFSSSSTRSSSTSRNPKHVNSITTFKERIVVHKPTRNPITGEFRSAPVAGAGKRDVAARAEQDFRRVSSLKDPLFHVPKSSARPRNPITGEGYQAASAQVPDDFVRSGMRIKQPPGGTSSFTF